MTREEAISVLAESKRQNEVMRDNPSTFWASHQMADGVKNAKRRIEALDVALTALRPVSREQVEKTQKKNEISGDPEVCAKNIFGSDILCHRNCWICWNKPAPKEYQNMDKKKVEVEDRWAYMEDGSAVCPRCGKRYERRKFEFVGACCEACGANNIVKTEIKEDE